MPIELTREVRAEAVASIQRYFERQLETPIGNIAAAGVLNFFWKSWPPASTTRLSWMCRNACRHASPRWTSKSTRKSSSIGASWTSDPGVAGAEPRLAAYQRAGVESGRSNTSQVVVACAYRVPSGPTIRASAVASCRPQWITLPSARTRGVFCGWMARTRLTPSSAVV